MIVGPRFLWVRSENWEWFPNLSHCRSEMEMSPTIYVRWETLPALQAPPTPSHVHGERRLEAHSRELCGPCEKKLGFGGEGGGPGSTQDLNLFHPNFLPRFLTAYCPAFFSESLISKVLFRSFIQQILIEHHYVPGTVLGTRVKGSKILASDLLLPCLQTSWIQDMTFLLLNCRSAITHILPQSWCLSVHWLGWPIMKPWFGWLRRSTFPPAHSWLLQTWVLPFIYIPCPATSILRTIGRYKQRGY